MGPDAMIARRWIERSGGWAAATGKMPVGPVAPPRWRLPMRRSRGDRSTGHAGRMTGGRDKRGLVWQRVDGVENKLAP